MVPRPPAYLVARFLRRELNNIRNYDVDWSTRLWLYRNGFVSNRDVVYDISPDNVDQFLSEYDWMSTKNINTPYSSGLENKLFFHQIVSQTHPGILPDFHGVLSNKGLFQPEGVSSEVDSIEDLVASSGRSFVIKPVDGMGGKDVHVVTSSNGSFLFDEEPISEHHLFEKLQSLSDYVVVDFVNQSGYADDIYPHAVNTIRALTMIDPDTQEPFIATAVHRFGSDGSKPVDNWSSGGLSASLDVDTGRLGEAVSGPKTGEINWFANHPDTGVLIDGQKVPEWDSIRDELLDLSGEYGWMWPYVGWDVAVTDDSGSFTIIEGNMYSDVDLLQAHKPLLSDPRTRRFYEHHGIC